MLLLLSILSPLLPIIAGLRRRNNFLWWYAVCSILNEGLVPVVRRCFQAEVAITSNLFALCECCLIFLFYKNKVFPKGTLFYFWLGISLSFFITLTTFDTGWFRLNRLGISVFLIEYIGLSIWGFFTILRQQKILFLEQSSFFWSNIAILIYSSGAFFLFLLTIHIKTAADKATLIQLWNTLFLSLNILKNILLAIALSKKEDA
ncbi:hypothetical protein [Taibaiella helva]|uniref:hypothetical protein n=1 Tax=Taibaiella helva TaxID=2301235 RepID=UPI000E570757|nr:hypothetical protein [Taibaiella helva]